jgi:putative endonuclease
VHPSHIDVGQRGEAAAACWLESRGWTIHARGQRVAGVEVDIIAEDPVARALVVVEVKARHSGRVAACAPARPEENVNREKLARLARAAHALEPRARHQGLSIRIDVIAVCLGRIGTDADRIDHFPDATG